MIFDMNSDYLSENVILFSDWKFNTVVPKTDSQVKESITLRGRSSTTVYRTGTSDDKE